MVGIYDSTNGVITVNGVEFPLKSQQTERNPSDWDALETSFWKVPQ
jgi:hypothetical protein